MLFWPLPPLRRNVLGSRAQGRGLAKQKKERKRKKRKQKKECSWLEPVLSGCFSSESFDWQKLPPTAPPAATDCKFTYKSLVGSLSFCVCWCFWPPVRLPSGITTEMSHHRMQTLNICCWAWARCKTPASSSYVTDLSPGRSSSISYPIDG